jgi:hypothetical protein
LGKGASGTRLCRANTFSNIFEPCVITAIVVTNITSFEDGTLFLGDLQGDLRGSLFSNSSSSSSPESQLLSSSPESELEAFELSSSKTTEAFRESAGLLLPTAGESRETAGLNMSSALFEVASAESLHLYQQPPPPICHTFSRKLGDFGNLGPLFLAEFAPTFALSCDWKRCIVKHKILGQF